MTVRAVLKPPPAPETYRVSRKTLEQIRRQCLAPYGDNVRTQEQQVVQLFNSVRIIERKVASILGVKQEIAR